MHMLGKQKKNLGNQNVVGYFNYETLEIMWMYFFFFNNGWESGWHIFLIQSYWNFVFI